MTAVELATLKAVCVDLIHACEVGASEGLLDEDEAAEGRALAMDGIAILARVAMED